MDASVTLAVASYNIHRCVGSDGRKDPDRVAAVVDELGCNVIGLQEVESKGPSGSRGDQLDYLARRGGYQGIAGPTMKEPEGQYGNALLIQGHVLDVRRYLFGGSGREPRGALEARFEIRGLSLRAIVTHLGLRPAERRYQVSKLLDIVDGEGNHPTILFGDFNEWIPWAGSRRRLRERFGRIPKPATFPSRRPIFALDHIWVQPREALARLECIRTPRSRIASDHLPLRASISLPCCESTDHRSVRSS
jgi:endonuclease/exonuclease/phosphatase family metal-dependent hydrolase